MAYFYRVFGQFENRTDLIKIIFHERNFIFPEDFCGKRLAARQRTTGAIFSRIRSVYEYFFRKMFWQKNQDQQISSCMSQLSLLFDQKSSSSKSNKNN